MTAEPPPDLAVVIVSTNEASWLAPCLTTVFARAGGARLDVVVVDNDSTDGTRALVEERFPRARVVASENRGFAHANNRGALTTRARHVLFLNPDTELLEGTLGTLVARMDAEPAIGLAGVRQVTADGRLHPTIRAFPTVRRALGQALGAERWPGRWAWARERELDLRRYDADRRCDWTSGSFMLVRREALDAAGLLDERFFLYSEEPDLCLRIVRAGWEVRHLAAMTILHHAGKGGIRPRMVAQDAYARRQYARKHFRRGHREAYLAAVATGHLLRAAVPDPGERTPRRAAARLALRTLAGRAAPPFGPPPPTALPRRWGR